MFVKVIHDDHSLFVIYFPDMSGRKGKSDGAVQTSSFVQEYLQFFNRTEVNK